MDFCLDSRDHATLIQAVEVTFHTTISAMAATALTTLQHSCQTQVPIGPIGAYLTLSDGTWAIATDILLSPQLQKWIVHNKEDLQALKTLAAQLRDQMREPTIIVTDFDRPAYTIPASMRVPQGWQSLRQCLRIDHPQLSHIIDNKLVDLVRQVESCVYQTFAAFR